MRRVLFGLLWFVLIAVSALLLSSVFVAVTGCPETDEFAVGYDCGKTISDAFMARYRLPIILGALLLSIAGTVAGVLPGTKKR